MLTCRCPICNELFEPSPEDLEFECDLCYNCKVEVDSTLSDFSDEEEEYDREPLY